MLNTEAELATGLNSTLISLALIAFAFSFISTRVSLYIGRKSWLIVRAREELSRPKKHVMCQQIFNSHH